MPSASIILTPSQLSRRAELYHQFAQLTVAGLGLVQIVEQLRRHAPHPSYRAPLALVQQSITRGFTFTESLRHAGDWLPEFDLSLIEAGERSGKMDESFRKLGDYYRDRATMARQMIMDMLYPLFLFHFALFIIPFSSAFVSGNWLGYVIKIGAILLPLYVLAGIVVFAMQSGHGERWRSLVETVLHPIPILGSARRDLALARLSMSLEALISSGVNVVQAWELAGAVSGSSRYRRTVEGWKRTLESGATHAEVITASRQFPEMFTSQYAGGEVSGKLDEVLRRLHHYYQETGQAKMRALAQWTPKLVYLLIAIGIGIYIVRFYLGYFQQIGNAVNGF